MNCAGRPRPPHQKQRAQQYLAILPLGLSPVRPRSSLSHIGWGLSYRVGAAPRCRKTSTHWAAYEARMRLRPKHIAGLTPFERQIYAPLIGYVDFKGERRTQFIAQSQHYVEGDEHVLPFAERSKRGVMLFSLCQHLTASQAAFVFAASVPQHILHIKRKLLAMGTFKVYALPPEHLLACIYANGENPFDFWRNTRPLELPQLDLEGANVLCALDPPVSVIKDTTEWTVRGALLQTPPTAVDVQSSPYFREAAHIGLTDVTSVGGKSWITRE